MSNVSRDEFEELHEVVFEINDNLRALSGSLTEYVTKRGQGEKCSSDGIIQWHAQVTAHRHALCTIAATCALLLTEAGVEVKSVADSIDIARLAIPQEMREGAKPIFDAVLGGVVMVISVEELNV